MNNHIEQFRDSIRSAGLIPPEIIEPDGSLHRFASNGKRGDDAGWYALHDDGIPAGSFGDWRTGLSQTWRADIGRNLTPAEEAEHRAKVEAMKREREEAKAREQADATKKAAAIWKAAKPAPEDHPYLKLKGIKPHGAKQHGDSLVILMRAVGEIQSLQFIAPDGDKRFLTGGRVSGCYFSIGNTKGAEAICIAEGFATGASIHEATGYPVAVGFNAGNLLAVAKVMREKFPEMRLILCGDDDVRTEGNPGIRKATEAALSVGGLLAIPDFGSDRPEGATDFNDMAQLCGTEAVERAIANAQAPARAVHQAEVISAPVGEYARSVELIRACDITPESVDWLWDGWIAAGKMHILGGAPGTGKTTIAMALAATLTTAGRWPDGTRSPVGNVAIWSGEDDLKNVLIPRLSLSGADLTRVSFIADVFEGKDRRPFDPATDMETLKRKLAEVGDIRLLIVDSIVSAVTGDGNSNPQVRKSLQPFVDLGNDHGIAVLGITHFRKSSQGSDPVERINGSIAYAALARVVMVAAKQRENGEDGRTVRIFLRAKSNYGPDDGGFEYDLQQGEMKSHPGVFASYALWGNAVEGAARELLATAETADEEGGESVASVSEWLRDLLNDEGGKLDRREVMKAANAMGHKERTIHRARKKLGLVVVQHGFGKDKRSIWTWPMHASIVPIVPNINAGTHGIYGTHGAGDSKVEVEI
jgi:putative DNA primase/helicase